MMKLTKREEQVYNLLIKGYSESEIAGLLCVELSTINTHKIRILKKKGVHSVKQLLVAELNLLRAVVDNIYTNLKAGINVDLDDLVINSRIINMGEYFEKLKKKG